MQNSAKHLIAVLVGFAVILTLILSVRAVNEDAGSALVMVYTLVISGVLAAVCIIIAVRHKETRRYFLSLSLVMICNCFAEVYLGLNHMFLGEGMVETISLPITDIAFIGADAFAAALCARLWYEGIPKTVKNRRKVIIAASAAVLFITVVGIVCFLSGILLLTGVFFLAALAAEFCYAVRFFTAPAAAKPFLPLMAAISLYVVYSALCEFILPIFYETEDELFNFLLFLPPTLLIMLYIPALLYAVEQMRKRAGQSTAGVSTAGVRSAAAENVRPLSSTCDRGVTPAGWETAGTRQEIPHTGSPRTGTRGLMNSVIGKSTSLKHTVRKNIFGLLLFFIFGMLACYLAGFVNTFIGETLGLSDIEMTLYLAPIAEECLKAIPVAVVFFLLKPDFKALLPAAIACGAGFGVFENILYAVLGIATPAEMVIRLFSTGIMHALTVALFAAALWYVTQKGLNPSWFITGMCGFGVLAAGITLHGCFNLFINATGFVQYIGYTIPIAFAVVYVVLLCFWSKRRRRAAGCVR